MFTLTKELTKQYKESFQKQARVTGAKCCGEECLCDLGDARKISRCIRLIWNNGVANQKASGRCWMFAR